jgi:hypothetical protein
VATLIRPPTICTEETDMSEHNRGDDEAAFRALATMLGQSMKSLEITNEAQEIAILGTAAIAACLVDTGKIPTERLGAVVGLLTQGRAEIYRKKVTDFISLTVTVSKKLPQALAAQKLAMAKAVGEAATATKN